MIHILLTLRYWVGGFVASAVGLMAAAVLAKFYMQDGHEAFQEKHPFFARHPDLLRWGVIGIFFAVYSAGHLIFDPHK